MSKQDRYTRSAKGQTCTVRIPGVCNHNPETVVFAHINGGGMGMKRANIHGAYCCASCHDAVDMRVKLGWRSDELRLFHLQGMLETQERMIKSGVLVL